MLLACKNWGFAAFSLLAIAGSNHPEFQKKQIA
jgi:hypothetical protein